MNQKNNGTNMTQEQEQLKAVQDSIRELPISVIKDVELIAGLLRELVKTHGPTAQISIALVGAEMAAEAS